MKKLFSILLLILLITQGGYSQKVYGLKGKKSKEPDPPSSVGMQEKKYGLFGHRLAGVRSIMLSGLGPAYMFGDIGGSLKSQAMFGVNDWNVVNTRYMVSIGMRHIFTNNFAIKGSFSQGIFAGSDDNTRNSSRSISFKSNVLEASLQGEYVLIGGPKARPRLPYMFYVFAGFGVLNSNSTVSGDIEKLKYSIVPSITTPVIPFGIGYQHEISDKLSLGGEFGWHYALSDYVDGIHTLESKNNDVIALLSFTFTYKIYDIPSKKNNCNCNHR